MALSAMNLPLFAFMLYVFFDHTQCTEAIALCCFPSEQSKPIHFPPFSLRHCEMVQSAKNANVWSDETTHAETAPHLSDCVS